MSLPPNLTCIIQNAIAMDRSAWLMFIVVIEYVGSLVYVDYPKL